LSVGPVVLPRITEHIDDCPNLRALALPFAGHPDFRDEWNP
jgi:hypothetical protein